jgi:hypothetical protein
MDTLLLDLGNNDLCLDAVGNIAQARPPYAAAQDAASAIKLFQGDYWYDTTLGVPYFAQILAQRPPMALVRAKLVAAALTVPDVVSARCFFTSFTDRLLKGQVQVTDTSGRVSIAGF